MSASATTPGEKCMRKRGGSARVRVLGMLILTLALLLAGCGVTSVAGGSASSSTQTASATATAQPTQTAPPVANSTSCSSSNQQTTDVGHPTYVLTAATSGHTVTAHVGDTVQVRLTATSRWSFQAPKQATALSSIAPSGLYAPSLNACVWTFQAVATGSQTLSYGGSPVCKAGEPCAAYRIAMTFSVNVA